MRWSLGVFASSYYQPHRFLSYCIVPVFSCGKVVLDIERAVALFLGSFYRRPKLVTW